MWISQEEQIGVNCELADGGSQWKAVTSGTRQGGNVEDCKGTNSYVLIEQDELVLHEMLRRRNLGQQVDGRFKPETWKVVAEHYGESDTLGYHKQHINVRVSALRGDYNLYHDSVYISRVGTMVGLQDTSGVFWKVFPTVQMRQGCG